MNEGSARNLKLSPAIARSVSVLAVTLIGPPLAALILILGIFCLDQTSRIPEGNFLSKYLLMSVGTAINVGILPSVIVALPMLHAFRNRMFLPMWSFLLGAALAVALMPLTIQMTELIVKDVGAPVANARIGLSGLYYFAGLCIIPALLSATICWRLTKRWHSPEPNP